MHKKQSICVCQWQAPFTSWITVPRFKKNIVRYIYHSCEIIRSFLLVLVTLCYDWCVCIIRLSNTKWRQIEDKLIKIKIKWTNCVKDIPCWTLTFFPNKLEYWFLNYSCNTASERTSIAWYPSLILILHTLTVKELDTPIHRMVYCFLHCIVIIKISTLENNIRSTGTDQKILNRKNSSLGWDLEGCLFKSHSQEWDPTDGPLIKPHNPNCPTDWLTLQSPLH